MIEYEGVKGEKSNTNHNFRKNYHKSLLNKGVPLELTCRDSIGRDIDITKIYMGLKEFTKKSKR